MAQPKNISPAQAKELAEQGWILVDVRSEEEFAGGHPEGALNIPVMHKTMLGMKANPDFVEVVVSRLPKDSKLVMTCKSGQRSMTAGLMLVEAGYADVTNLEGGLLGESGWQSAGLPVATEAPAEHLYTYLKG